jgi:hypothetical protein
MRSSCARWRSDRKSEVSAAAFSVLDREARAISIPLRAPPGAQALDIGARRSRISRSGSRLCLGSQRQSAGADDDRESGTIVEPRSIHRSACRSAPPRKALRCVVVIVSAAFVAPAAVFRLGVL